MNSGDCERYCVGQRERGFEKKEKKNFFLIGLRLRLRAFFFGKDRFSFRGGENLIFFFLVHGVAFAVAGVSAFLERFVFPPGSGEEGWSERRRISS